MWWFHGLWPWLLSDVYIDEYRAMLMFVRENAPPER